MGLRSKFGALRSRLRPAKLDLDTELDVEFYRVANLDLAHLDRAADLARHYALHGKHEGRHPNQQTALAALEAAFGPLPAHFDPDEYRTVNPDLKTVLTTPWASIEHYLRYGRREERGYLDFDVELYKALHLGDRRSSDADARRHYEVQGRRQGLTASWKVLLADRGLGARWTAWLRVEEFAILNWSWAGKLSTSLDAVNLMLSEGVDRLAPIAFDLQFEPAYYRDVHPDWAGETDAGLYRRWLFVGLEDDEPGSSAQHLKRLKLDLNTFPGAFDWRGYAARSRLARATRWSALDHLVSHGLAHAAVIPVSGDGSSECLIALSAAFAFRNDRLAIRLGEAARASGQSDATALQGLADCYFRQQRWAEALALYRQVVDLPEANIWTFSNGVRAALKTGQRETALDLLTQGRDKVAGDPQFRAVVREGIEAAFHPTLDEARTLYVVGRRDDADALLHQAVDHTAERWAALDPLGARLPPGQGGRVVMLANTDLPQCTHYRVEQKAQLFEVLGRELTIFGAGEIDDFISALPGATAAIFYRLPAFPMVVRAIEVARALGVATYYEIDDLIFARCYPEPFETYGGAITPETYAGLQLGVPLFRAAIARCEFGIASTTALARHMEPLVRSGRVFVLPNGLDADNEPMLVDPPRRLRRDTDLVVFYGSGTMAHNSDFLALAGPALAGLMRERADLKLTIVGYQTLNEQFSDLQDRLTCVDFTPDIRAYWSLLAEADVNLAVLSANEITDAKSEIKWLEAGALGIPSIVSDTVTYREVVEDGVDGLIARDMESWRSALEGLIGDPALRRRMGDAARDKATRLYSREANAARLAAALRPAIDRAAAARQDFAKLQRIGRKRRILLVNVFFPPQTIGGATRVVRDNLDQLLAGYGEEFEFAVVTSDQGAEPRPGARVETYRGATVFRLSTPEEPNMDWRPLNADLGDAFSDILECWRPDLVHFHAVQRLTASTLRACLDAGTPYVVTVHDAWWISDYQFLVDERGRLQPPCPAIPLDPPPGKSAGESVARRRAIGELLAGAEAVLGVSRAFTEIYRVCGYDKAVALPNGVSAMPISPRTPSPFGRVRLAHVGGQSMHKGYHLVEAALKHANFAGFELTVVDHARFGGAVYHDVWGATPVRIVGKTRQEQMHLLYAEQDVLLAPSIWPESFGLVTREALRAGLWVVASDRGAMGEDVTPGCNGFVVDVSSPQALFDALAKIHADPARYLGAPSPTSLRTSADQARELVQVYRTYARAPTCESVPALARSERRRTGFANVGSRPPLGRFPASAGASGDRR